MEEEKNQNLYEISFWISPDLKEKEIKDYVNQIKKIIQDFNGKIKKELNPVKKKLAYEINKKSFGYFGTIYFYLNPNDIKILDKKIKSEKNILRFLIIKISKFHLKAVESQISIGQSKSIKKTTIKEGLKQKTTKEKMVSLKPEKEKPSEKSPKKEEIKLKELDKKLEEILGKNF